MSENTHWARLVEREDGALVVFEITPFDPTGKFDASLRFEPCPPETRQGSVYDPVAKTWTHPVEPEPVEPSEPVPAEPQYRTLMTPIRFKAQFPIAAQVKIKRARAYVDGTDPDSEADKQKAFARDVLDVLFGSLDDPRLTEVDVTDPTVIHGVEFVASLDILTPEEADTIKRGVPV